MGRRIVLGAGYEQMAPDAADYLIVIDFDDLEGSPVVPPAILRTKSSARGSVSRSVQRWCTTSRWGESRSYPILPCERSVVADDPKTRWHRQAGRAISKGDDFEIRRCDRAECRMRTPFPTVCHTSR